MNQWKAGLSRVEGVSPLWAVGLLVSIDWAFPNQASYDKTRGDTLLSRLQALPNAPLSELANLLSLGESDAAVLVIPDGRLWTAQGAFDSAAFASNVAALRVALGAK